MRPPQKPPPTPPKEGSANSVQTNSSQARSPLLRRFPSPGGGTEGGLKTIDWGRFPPLPWEGLGVGC